MLDFDGEGRLRPLVYEGATAEDRKRFEARLYLRYKYNLSHYLRFYRDMSKKLELPVKLSFNVARHSWASLARKHGVSVSVISAGTGAHFRKDHANLPRRTGQQHRGRCERDGGGTAESSGSGSGKKGGEKVEISEKIVFLLSDRSSCVSRGCGKNTVFSEKTVGASFSCGFELNPSRIPGAKIREKYECEFTPPLTGIGHSYIPFMPKAHF